MTGYYLNVKYSCLLAPSKVDWEKVKPMLLPYIGNPTDLKILAIFQPKKWLLQVEANKLKRKQPGAKDYDELRSSSRKKKVKKENLAEPKSKEEEEEQPPPPKGGTEGGKGKGGGKGSGKSSGKGGKGAGGPVPGCTSKTSSSSKNLANSSHKASSLPFLQLSLRLLCNIDECLNRLVPPSPTGS
eukprot:g70330.t1